jgi:hypothetical protein
MLTFFDDYKVPGTEYTVAGHMMIEPESTRFVLEFVLESCGHEAATCCALEMKRRREERRRTIGAFLVAYSETEDVDASIAAAIAWTRWR